MGLQRRKKPKAPSLGDALVWAILSGYALFRVAAGAWLSVLGFFTGVFHQVHGIDGLHAIVGPLDGRYGLVATCRQWRDWLYPNPVTVAIGFVTLAAVAGVSVVRFLPN